MPEGDTVWRTATRLNLALAGSPLTVLELRWGDLGGVTLLPAHTVSVVSRGKHLLHRLDTGLTLHTHLRMEGQWRIHATGRLEPGAARDPNVRAVVATSTWTAVGLRLGLMELWPTREEESRLGHLGPDLLGDDWDLARAVDNLSSSPSRSTDSSIGSALLDQRNLAGIGTFWASEGLFLNHVDPWAACDQLPPARIEEVVTTIRRQMRQSCRLYLQNTTGRPQRGEASYVHGRSGQTCRRCGTVVRVAGIGTAPHDRVMFYCPSCQGGLAPTDSGAPAAPLRSRLRSLRTRPT